MTIRRLLVAGIMIASAGLLIHLADGTRVSADEFDGDEQTMLPVAVVQDDSSRAIASENEVPNDNVDIDQWVNDMFGAAAANLSAVVFYEVEVGGVRFTLVIVWLIVAAVFFTASFRFVNIWGLPQGLRIVQGDYSYSDAPGEISHFQALCTALSGTVGIGNIGAMAYAIAYGGPGVLFWLIVAGFFGMTTKFVECTLGVKYRRQNADGSVSGGPMYFLERGFAERGMMRIGKFLGGFYAIGMVVGCLGVGNMFQSNQAYSQFVVVTGGPNSFFVDKGWLFGLITALVLGLVIIGGIKSIAKVTSKLVPLMAVLYCVFAVIIIVMNIQYVPTAILWVFRDAFHPRAVSGGMVGIIMIGFQRALFSNEAGLGSASVAHSAVKTQHPVTEGLVATIGPFLDTIVICSLTSMCIITSMVAVSDFQSTIPGGGENLAMGIQLTSAAFERNISWSPYLIAVAAMLFALSTMISWSYYGAKAWTYLVGEGTAKTNVFNFVFCVFAALGCMVQLGPVIEISDALIYLICVPNIIGLYVLGPAVKRDLDDYFDAVRNGEITGSHTKKNH